VLQNILCKKKKVKFENDRGRCTAAKLFWVHFFHLSFKFVKRQTTENIAWSLNLICTMTNMKLLFLLRPYSHETFWHTILRYKDKKIILSHMFQWPTMVSSKNIPWIVLFVYLPLFIFCKELTLAFRYPRHKNIFLSQYWASKCLVWIRPKEATS